MNRLAQARSIWQENGIVSLLDHGRIFALRRLHLYLWDKKFERFETVPTSGSRTADQLNPVDRTNFDETAAYLASPRLVVNWALKGLQVDLSKFSFVDFGSGRGRVLFAAAEEPFKSITGIEFCKTLDAEAKQNIESYPDKHLVCRKLESKCIDAARYELPEGDCVLFFFNPFEAELISEVTANVVRTATRRKSRLFFIYFNPAYLDAMARHAGLSPKPLALRQRILLKLFSPYPVKVFEFGAN